MRNVLAIVGCPVLLATVLLATVLLAGCTDGRTPARSRPGTSAPSVDIAPRSAAAALPTARTEVAGTRVYVTGGFGPATGENAMWSLGRGESVWRDEPPMPAPRAAHAMVGAGTQLFVIGGFSDGRRLARLDIFDPATRRWSAGPPLRQEREHLAAAYAAGRIYVIGGRLAGLGSNLRSVESWAPGEAAWRSEPNLIDSRGGTAAAAVRDQPCVAGGEEPTGTIASVECLDAASGWQTVATLQTPRHGLAVVALGDALHVVAGGPQPGLTVSAAHEVLLV